MNSASVLSHTALMKYGGFATALNVVSFLSRYNIHNETNQEEQPHEQCHGKKQTVL